MKKGCFIKSIIFITIFIAAVLYIIQHKFDDFILNPGKKAVKQILESKWEEELTFVHESEQKDSLRAMLENFIDDLNLSDIENNANEDLVKQVQTFFADSVITSSELRRLEELIKEIEYERSKKN